jgi:hypothetical protein
VETVDKSRIWIDLTNEQGAGNFVGIHYRSNDDFFETAFDGETMMQCLC